MTSEALMIGISFPSHGSHSGKNDWLSFGLVMALLLLLPLANTANLRNKQDKSISGPNTKANERKEPHLCWKYEKFLTKSKCMQCGRDEKNNIPACKETGNRQLIQCEKTKMETYISCSFVGSVEKKRFWAFEAISFAFAVISNVAVWWRRRFLNHVQYQRVKRQMSDGSV